MRRRTVLLAGVLAFALAAGCVGSQSVDPVDSGDPNDSVTVTAVVDGDTIDVRPVDGTEERVRLLGIDTPEVHVENRPEHYDGVPNTADARACLRTVGENASAFVRDRIEDESVRLEGDAAADRRGGHGRLLAYVHHEDRNLNYVLVSRGYADVYPTEFGERDRFEAAATDARSADRGLWRCRSS